MVDKRSLELADLVQRSMLLGVNLGCSLNLEYDEEYNLKGVILGKLDYKDLGVEVGDVLKIYVPVGVTEVGANAFVYDPMILNYRVLKIYLPDTCKRIRSHAFDVYMRTLKVYGENIIYIDDYAFFNLAGGSVMNFPNLTKVLLFKKSFYGCRADEIEMNLHNFNGKLSDIIKEE